MSNVRIMPVVLATVLVTFMVMCSRSAEPVENKNELGFVSLFDGTTFDGWLNPTSRWSIKDGRMMFSGEPTSDGIQREDHKLMSVKEYDDFVLRFEFKIGRRANSGVAVRAPLRGDAAFVAMEIQIIDNHHWKGLKTWQKHGSIYGVVPAITGHLKQPGEWNIEEIVCQGSHVTVTLNGAVIVDVDLNELGSMPLDGEEHPGLKRTRGHIGFLPHTKSSEYRNIRIKRLPKSPPEAERNSVARSDVGQYYLSLHKHADGMARSLSYLARDWPDREQWRIQGRAKMHELLAYDPPAGPLNAQVLERVQKDGFTRSLVRYSVTADRTTDAFLLIPDNLKGPAPAVVAIHDHGGFYYFGKEKITQTENPPDALTGFIERSYGGRTFADELARRGFVVLVPDGFYFGSQRLDPAKVSERFTGALTNFKPGIDDYIQKFNRFASAHETLTAKTIFTSGATWPGILFQGDRASIDYLLTRDEVDPERIGCIGLSIGGFRSAHLAGLDPRIKAAVVAGWMTTYDTLLKDHLRSHTWMIYVPGQLRYLDLPDVVSLNAPRPLMVINCLQDRLFTLKGMQAAERKLATIYEKMDAPERFQCRYYDVPHSLNVSMQDDATRWLERWLK